MGNDLRIGKAILWVVFYIAVMFFYTFLKVAIWEKAFPKNAALLNFIAVTVCVGGFLAALEKKGRRLYMFENINLTGILTALGCSVLLFFVMDKGIDPALARLFPKSEQRYQEAVEVLRRSPITSMMQICILAPLVEEALMRGFVLGGLKNTYGAVSALVISSVIFALLHFNMVQTLSALLCGIVLGLLYLKTDSLFCCILAHCGYNLMSYVVILRGSL